MRTAVFGKMHLNRAAAPGLFGFDVMMTENEIRAAWMKDVKPQAIPPKVRTKPPWKPFQDPARIWLNAEKLPYPRIEAEMLGTYIADRAVGYLEENAAKPFAMWVSFMEPHSPFDFPVEYRDRFDARRFGVPRVGSEDGWQIPIIFRDLDDDEKRGINAAYYTSVSFLDRNIGRVLAGLRRLKLEDDTFVVYMADHGYDLGHHGRFEKHCGYDQAMRVPLIMRYPGRVRRGVVNDLTEHVDVLRNDRGCDEPGPPSGAARAESAALSGGTQDGECARARVHGVPGKRRSVHTERAVEVHFLFREARPHGWLCGR